MTDPYWDFNSATYARYLRKSEGRRVKWSRRFVSSNIQLDMARFIMDSAYQLFAEPLPMLGDGTDCQGYEEFFDLFLRHVEESLGTARSIGFLGH